MPIPMAAILLSINGKELLKNAALAEAVKSVERISFRTGAYRDLAQPDHSQPGRRIRLWRELIFPVRASEYYIDDLKMNPD